MANDVRRAGRAPRRRALLLGAVLLFLAGQLAWGAGPAAAHADLLWSFPNQGATVPVPPGQVVLELAEPFDARLSQVVVTDPDGVQRDVTDVSVSRTGELVATLAPGVGPLGSWRVDYRVVSADGHVVTGRIDFGVGAPAEASAPTTVSGTQWAVGLVGAVALLLLLVHLRRSYAVTATDRVEARVD